MINDFTDVTEVKADLIMYLQLLLDMKKDGYTLYANSWKGLLRKLKELSDDPKIQHDIISQSIERGYKSFFPVNNYGNTKDKRRDENMEYSVPHMTEEDYIEEEKRLAELEAKGIQVRF